MNSPITQRYAKHRRRGFTLVEFTVSSLIVAILMAGMGSCIHLVIRAARLSEGPTAVASDSARVAEEVLADLRLAQVFQKRGPGVVEFTIPDRDGDEASERIRYQWTGGSTSALQKTLTLSNNPSPSNPVTVATNVREFALDYRLKNWGDPPAAPEVESDEVLLICHDVLPSLTTPRVLLVVNEAANLIAPEAALKGLFESWNMVVETIGSTASQADIGAAAARNQVAYVCSSANTSMLGSKLRYLPIGVVNELPDQVDELGFAAWTGSSQTSTILDDTVGTHYLARSCIPGSPVKLFGTAQSMRGLTSNTGVWAPGLEVIGRRNGEPVLAAIQTGAELYQPSGSSSMKLGESLALPTRSALGATYVATRFTLETTLQASQMSARVQGSLAATVRFGIYADNAGSPGNLIAQTMVGTVLQTTSHWMTCAFPSSLTLSPGTYWLTAHLPSNVDIYYQASGGTSRYASATLTTLDNLRSTWSGTTGPDPNLARFSIYVSGSEIPLARGRRVLIPWGGNNLNLQSLTEEGQLLLKRAVLWAAEAGAEDPGSDFGVSSTVRPAQYLQPPLPQNATGWRMTRVFCRLRANSWSFFDSLTFRLHQASLAEQPSELQLQQTYPIPTYTWPTSRYVWYEIPFAPSRKLPPSGGVCISWAGSSSTARVVVNYDAGKTWMTASSHLVDSSDSGFSWSAPTSNQDVRYYVYGKYLTQGDPIW